MNIGGWHKVSLMDFPERIASVIFTNGCVFRCHFCYNTGLVCPPWKVSIDEEEIFSYLKRRQGILEGIVITGGEPTVQSDLLHFIARVHSLGYEVKVDTCGYLPEVVKDIIASGMVQYIAMDIKAPLSKYSDLVGVFVDTAKIVKSIQLILHSGIPYEFRSTLIEGIHNESDILEMAQLIQGARQYFLQQFQATSPLIDPQFSARQAPARVFLEDMALKCKEYVEHCEVR